MARTPKSRRGKVGGWRAGEGLGGMKKVTDPIFSLLHTLTKSHLLL